MAKTLEGLAPIISAHSRVLILGSFPSASSLSEQQYYAHQRNQFWTVMQHLFGIDSDLPYMQRCVAICQQRLAIWDVIKCCKREGSLDSHIRDYEANDFSTFYQCNQQIVAVFFNGKLAERYYIRLMQDVSTPVGVGLPSTSPANTMSLTVKLKHWQAVREVLR